MELEEDKKPKNKEVDMPCAKGCKTTINGICACLLVSDKGKTL